MAAASAGLDAGWPWLLLMYSRQRETVPVLKVLWSARLQAEKEARVGQIAKLTARLQEMEVAQGHLAERNRLLETCLMINSPGSEQVCVCTA